MPTILITRPQPDAQETEHALFVRHIQTLVYPLLQMNHLATGLNTLQNFLHSITTPSLCILSSRNTIRALTSTSFPNSISFIAVGERTARLAQKTGLAPILSVNGNESILVNYIRCHYSPDVPLLYPCAQDVMGTLIPALTEDRYTINAFPIYQMQASTFFSDELIQQIKTHKIDGISLFSKRTANIFMTLIKQYQLESCLSSMHAFCLSPSIARTLHSLRFASIQSCQRPEHDSLLELICNFRFN